MTDFTSFINIYDNYRIYSMAKLVSGASVMIDDSTINTSLYNDSGTDVIIYLPSDTQQMSVSARQTKLFPLGTILRVSKELFVLDNLYDAQADIVSTDSNYKFYQLNKPNGYYIISSLTKPILLFNDTRFNIVLQDINGNFIPLSSRMSVSFNKTIRLRIVENPSNRNLIVTPVNTDDIVQPDNNGYYLLDQRRRYIIRAS